MPDFQIICTRCRKGLQPKDWTCPACGAISDGLLFGTVTLKSLEGAGRNAYQEGYQNCVKQHSQAGSTAIRPETYNPTVGSETAYRAGWQNAADKLDAKADRKFGRRRGLEVLGSGIVLLSAGLVVAFVSGSVSRITVLEVAPLGLGVVNIVVGIAMLITGTTDEARPE
jgi:hypothetical protein